MRKYRRRICTNEKRRRLVARTGRRVSKLMAKTRYVSHKLNQSLTPEMQTLTSAIVRGLYMIPLDKLVGELGVPAQ